MDTIYRWYSDELIWKLALYRHQRGIEKGTSQIVAEIGNLLVLFPFWAMIDRFDWIFMVKKVIVIVKYLWNEYQWWLFMTF